MNTNTTHAPTRTFLATLPSGQTIRFLMDTARAEQPIRVLAWDDHELDEPAHTQWQTADAAHSPHEAALLLLRGGERDWYAEPHDERDTDEIIAEISDGMEVRSV
jgi:hypothetical protein